MSLDFHTLDPAKLDFDAVYQRDYTRFSTVTMLSGDHFWASFTHLNGYSSNYYTYVLDKVIALDFFAQFDPKHLLDGPAGMRYRQHGARAGREQARRAAGARLPRPGHESRGLPALDAGGVRGPGRGCARAGYGFRIRSLRRSRSLENGEFFCTSTRR